MNPVQKALIEYKQKHDCENVDMVQIAGVAGANFTRMISGESIPSALILCTLIDKLKLDSKKIISEMSEHYSKHGTRHRNKIKFVDLVCKCGKKFKLPEREIGRSKTYSCSLSCSAKKEVISE